MLDICIPFLYTAVYLTDACPDVLEWDLRIEFVLTTHPDFCPGRSRDTCYGRDMSLQGKCRSISVVQVERTGQTGRQCRSRILE